MKVKAKRSFSGKEGLVPLNTEITVDGDRGKELIEAGLVDEVKEKPKKKAK